MRYRKLGGTGLSVSEIGFGTWQIGGISWVAPSDEDCVSLLRRGFDAGINLFDASPSYGNGRSEALIAEAFHGMRDKIILSGKLGVLEDGTYHGFWSRRQLLESLEQSLRRLKTDYIDFLSIHAPPMDVLKAGYALELLAKLKAEGKARFIGVALEAQPEEALIALDQGIDVLQIRFNLLFQEARRVFSVVAEKGVGLLINSPFAHGYLSGRYKTYDDINDGDYPKGNFRASKPRELVEQLIRKANAFAGLANGATPTVPRAALKFVLAHEVVSSAIAGHRSVPELDDNVTASDGVYASAADVHRAAEIYQRESLGAIHTERNCA